MSFEQARSALLEASRHKANSKVTTSKTPTFGAHNLTGRSKAVHGNCHFSGRGSTPVVTTSSTAEEECPVRETYWTGGLSVTMSEARAENCYCYFKEG